MSNPALSPAKEKPAAARRASAPAPLEPFGLLYGASTIMRDLCDQIGKVAKTMATVLIVGESGTGKELVARTLHDMSPRKDQSFVPVNCGAIPAALIEAELFGHEKGSFTGATQQHIGYFEHASGGTIFLDEITEMAPEMQIKLLRVLETGSFHRVGGIDPIQVDVRVIAATNRDPHAAVKDGAFREDLLYRLAVFPLRVPPLRERETDVELLARHFLAQFNRAQKTERSFSRGTLDTLRQYNWPGNVRELKNAVHRAFILADEGVVDVVNPNMASRVQKPQLNDGLLSVWVGTPLAEAQREIILATLAHFDGDKRRTADALGVSLKTLYNRLEAYQKGETGSDDLG